MRRAAAFSLALLALGFAASAQLSITPRIGIESFQTTLRYNNLSSIKPAGNYASPQVSLRFDYRFLKMHSIFVGAATNRSAVSYRFTDPENGMYEYTATKSDYRLGLQTGYQFSFKPILLGSAKSISAAKTKTNTGASLSPAGKNEQSGCRSRCGNKSVSSAKVKSRSSYMRIQPFVGYSFVPGVKSNLSVKDVNGTPAYEYLAGNWSQAISTGVDFEFARGRHRFLVVGLQYLKGLDNMDPVVAEMASGNKSATASLSSTASSWSINIGIPIMLGGGHGYAKKAAYYPARISSVKEKSTAPQVKKTYYYNRCGSKKNLP